MFAQRKPEPVEYCAAENECDIYYGDLVFHNDTLDFSNKRYYICYNCMMKEVEEFTGIDFDKMPYEEHKKVMKPYIMLLEYAGFKLREAD